MRLLIGYTYVQRPMALIYDRGDDSFLNVLSLVSETLLCGEICSGMRRLVSRRVSDRSELSSETAKGKFIPTSARSKTPKKVIRELIDEVGNNKRLIIDPFPVDPVQ